MNRSRRFALLGLFLLAFDCGMVSSAQQAQNSATGGSCGMPVFSSVTNEPNNLTEQQEEWLGEVLAPKIQGAFNVIPDPENDYLDKLSERILAQLPPSKIHYRFTIIDLPANDSFGIPGGRIYLSRKILALVQSEDELAGLLAHEIGHIITHQAAIDLTHAFQTVLGVSQFGDQKDVIDKWNQLLDMYATKPEKYSSKREETQQLIADRIALYAMARAGYQPSRFVEFFDRLAQTGGNRGSFWTDMFGKTSRNSKRLRELLRASTPLAQNCVAAQPADAPARFLKWQSEVIGSKFAQIKEAVPGLIAKTALKPPLRSDLHSIQFSPDGKYMLAQDDNSVFVLSANPVTNLFTIDAPDTYAAQFTTDSRGIVFYDKELRVEKWDIEKQQRSSIYQVALAEECMGTALSHSGEVLACVTPQSEPELIKVSSNTVMFKGKKPKEISGQVKIKVQWVSPWSNVLSSLVRIRFSPDDRYVAMGRLGSAWAYDLQDQKELELPAKLREIFMYSFDFLAANEIIGYNFGVHDAGGPARLAFVLIRERFPSGETVDSFEPGLFGDVQAATKGSYLLLREPGQIAVKVLDLQSKKMVLMVKKPAFAIYDQLFVDESSGGEIGVFNISDKKYEGGVDLPSGRLGAALAVAFSASGNWLTVSSRTRGAVWKAETGERTALTRGFEGAWFDQDQLIAKFPAVFPGKGTDAAGVFKVSPGDGVMQDLYSTETKAGTPEVLRPPKIWQVHDLLIKISLDNSKRDARRFLLEVYDVRSNKKLWERTIEKESPHLHYSEAGKTATLVLGDYDNMKQEARNDARLTAGLASLADETRRKASYVLEVLDAASGRNTGAVLVDTGNLSFRVRDAMSAGDTVAVIVSDNRTLLYSLKTGAQRGRVFGYVYAISADGGKILVENGKEVDLYDTSSLESLVHFTFPAPMIHAEFSTDGMSMRVLTEDQVIYNVKAAPNQQSAGPQ